MTELVLSEWFLGQARRAALQLLESGKPSAELNEPRGYLVCLQGVQSPERAVVPFNRERLRRPGIRNDPHEGSRVVGGEGRSEIDAVVGRGNGRLIVGICADGEKEHRIRTGDRRRRDGAHLVGAHLLVADEESGRPYVAEGDGSVGGVGNEKSEMLSAASSAGKTRRPMRCGAYAGIIACASKSATLPPHASRFATEIVQCSVRARSAGSARSS